MGTVRYTTINGEVIAEKRNGVRREYVPDPLGSTVALLDNTQTQTDTFTYWPYGEVRTSTGTTPTPFQFVGTSGYYSDGTSQTYVQARYLHTQTSRWLTQDPIRSGGGDWNYYRYVDNDPVYSTDPSGLRPKAKKKHRGRWGIDFCDTDSNGHPADKKPLGRCPDGGTAVCVTCYTSGAKKNNPANGGGIGFAGQCGCGPNRAPHVGDCAVDNLPGHHQQCPAGSTITFTNFGLGKAEGHPCKACDTGPGNNGIDVFVPGGNERDCNKAMKKAGFSHATGWYCISCAAPYWPPYIGGAPLSRPY